MRHGYVSRPENVGVSRPFWFGSGFHYAMEDFHGYNKHGGLLPAFMWYVEETRKAKAVPENYEEDIILAKGMFEHYHRWQRNREKFTTVWVDGKPLVELEFHIPLDADLVGREGVTYSGVIDRVVHDEYGHLWLLDYKTAKVFDTAKLENDSQVSAYCWAAKEIFDLEVEGMVYWQFKKSYPKPPTMLANGKFSLNKQASTCYDLFKEAIDLLSGGSDRWRQSFPEYVDYLGHLASQETYHGDKYIRYDLVRRNENHLRSVHEQILLESSEMCDPNLPIYPNPTKDCSWDCPFRAPCIAKDEGSDWEYLLDAHFQRTSIEERNPYRDKEQWDVEDPDAYLTAGNRSA